MDKNSTGILASAPSSNVEKTFPSRTIVLAEVSFLSGMLGTFLKELNPRSRLLMFIPTSTLSSNFIREL